MSSIFHRMSIRKYEDRIVEKEKIELILRAAMAAPSACNQQPWEFYVVTDREKIKQLSQVSPFTGCAAKAAVVFVPCFRTNGLVAPAYADIDMSAAVENMLLQIDELGLGAVWMGISPQPERMEAVREVLNIPQELAAFALVSCGYPAENRKWQDRYDENRVHFV